MTAVANHHRGGQPDSPDSSYANPEFPVLNVYPEAVTVLGKNSHLIKHLAPHHDSRGPNRVHAQELFPHVPLNIGLTDSTG